MKRLVYRVRLARGKEREKGTWVLVLPPPDGSRYSWSYKAEAIAEGRVLARRDWRFLGKPAQLVVHNRDGRIAFENTYGRDPARTKG